MQHYFGLIYIRAGRSTNVKLIVLWLMTMAEKDDPSQLEKGPELFNSPQTYRSLSYKEGVGTDTDTTLTGSSLLNSRGWHDRSKRHSLD